MSKNKLVGLSLTTMTAEARKAREDANMERRPLWMSVFVRILVAGVFLALFTVACVEQWPPLEIAVLLGVGVFLTGLTFLAGNPDVPPYY